jgi:hypothetical protein
MGNPRQLLWRRHRLVQTRTQPQGSTVKLCLLLPVPAAVVTEIGPGASSRGHSSSHEAGGIHHKAGRRAIEGHGRGSNKFVATQL